MVAFVVTVTAAGGVTGQVLGYGGPGLVVAAVVAGAVAVAAWGKSDIVVVRVSQARPAGEVDCARLHNLVEGLCIADGLPKPRLYVVDDRAPNALATGRNPHHASLVVTMGLLERLNRVELEGVLAHELSHVKSYDIRVTTLAVTLVAGPTLVSDLAVRWRHRTAPGRPDEPEREHGRIAPLGLLAIPLLAVAPLVGRLLRVAVGPRRELLADASGVALTRYPPGLVGALEKLREGATTVRAATRATAHLWIAPPLGRDSAEGRGVWLDRQFDVHPSLEERISALREL